MLYSRCLANTLIDLSLMILLSGIKLLLGGKGPSIFDASLLWRLEFFRMFSKGLTNIGYNIDKGVLPIICEYMAINLTTMILTACSVHAYINFPKIFRISILFCAMILFPFVVRTLVPTQLYGMLIVIILLYFLYLLSIVNVSRNENTLPLLATAPVRPSKCLSFGFFTNLFLTFCILFMKLFLLRLRNLEYTSFLHSCFWLYSLSSEFFISKYKISCGFFVNFISFHTSKFRKVRFIEQVPLFFTTIIFGSIEPIWWIIFALDEFVRIFSTKKGRKGNLNRFTCYNLLNLYTAIIHTLPAPFAIAKTRRRDWGSIPTQVFYLQMLLTELIPAMFIIFTIIFFFPFKNLIFFRALEVFMIVFIYYIVVIEIFIAGPTVVILKDELEKYGEGNIE